MSSSDYSTGNLKVPSGTSSGGANGRDDYRHTSKTCGDTVHNICFCSILFCGILSSHFRSRSATIFTLSWRRATVMFDNTSNLSRHATGFNAARSLPSTALPTTP